MVNLSEQMTNVKSDSAKTQLRYWKDDASFGIPFYYHGMCVISIFFDPWNGNFLESSFNSHIEGMDNDLKKDLISQMEKKHSNGICNSLSYYVDGGEDSGMTPIIHIPNIRTFAILNKKEYGGFEPMDYCPFCGAKFPERLDVKLTEILQKEYGLNSWSDYKKAPREFHTDEWWRKRGL